MKNCECRAISESGRLVCGCTAATREEDQVCRQCNIGDHATRGGVTFTTNPHAWKAPQYYGGSWRP